MQYLMIFSILVLTNGGKYALIALRTCGRDTPGNNSGSHFWEVRIFILYTQPLLRGRGPSADHSDWPRQYLHPRTSYPAPEQSIH